MKEMKRITLVAMVVLGMTMPSYASAIQLVEGGFARSQESYSPPALSLKAPLPRQPLALPEIAFTPRHRSLANAGFGGETVTFRMDIDPRYGGGLDFNPPGHKRMGQTAASTLLVGGALEIEELGIIGGIGRTQLFGEQTDLLMAGMSVGGLKASLGMGETDKPVEGARDVFLLSTNLHLAPWISLQGDLAVSEPNQEQDSLAVGRVGVRLRF